jgi:beta-lactamase superfamily II metal-dependent hydrolase
MNQIRYNAYSSWRTGIITITAGATFTPLGDFPCDEVVILNPGTGVSLDLIASSWIAGASADTTQFVTLDTPSGTVIPVGGNANEIAVRRTDQASTSTVIRYIWRKFMR